MKGICKFLLLCSEHKFVKDIEGHLCVNSGDKPSDGCCTKQDYWGMLGCVCNAEEQAECTEKKPYGFVCM